MSWADNQNVVVKRNEKYWRPGQPFVDGIEFQIIPEIATGLRSVVAGYEVACRISAARSSSLSTGMRLRSSGPEMVSSRVTSESAFRECSLLSLGRSPARFHASTPP